MATNNQAQANGEESFPSYLESSSWSGRAVQKLIYTTKEKTGLNWWSSIALCTVGFRICMIPLSVKQVQITKRMFTGPAPAMFSHLTSLTTKEIRAAQGNYTKQREALRMWAKGTYLIKRKSEIKVTRLLAGPITQIFAFWMFLSASRDVIRSDLAKKWGLNEGGMLWFKDLTKVDPYFALPLSALALSYFSIEQSLMFSPILRNFFQTGLLLSSPFVLTLLPSGVFMTWIPSVVFSLGQSFLFRRVFSVAAVKASQVAPTAQKVVTSVGVVGKASPKVPADAIKAATSKA